MKPIVLGGSTFEVSEVDAHAGVYLVVGPRGGKYFARPDNINPGLFCVVNATSAGQSPFTYIRFQLVDDEFVPLYAPRRTGSLKRVYENKEDAALP
jgi:hypothetical protein